MRCVLQRVKKAKVEIDQRIKGKIEQGLLVLVGFEEADKEEDQVWMLNKILNMRIFDDEQGIMNKSVLEINGELLVVSQFTLHASTKKGNRPSYIRANNPQSAKVKYHDFVLALAKQNLKKLETGEFGANMQVSLINDGPVTILIDSKNKE